MKDQETHTPNGRPEAGATCRSCGRPLLAGAANAPFCSDRCRLADLNRWFSGEYRISREIKDSDLETVD